MYFVRGTKINYYYYYYHYCCYYPDYYCHNYYYKSCIFSFGCEHVKFKWQQVGKAETTETFRVIHWNIVCFSQLTVGSHILTFF